MATEYIYENEGVIDDPAAVPPPLNPDYPSDTVIYEVFEAGIKAEQSGTIGINPVVAYETIEEENYIPPGLQTGEQNPPTIGELITQNQPRQHSIFHRLILFLFEFYTLQIIEKLPFDIPKVIYKRIKVVIQLITFLLTIVVTIETNRELFLDYRVDTNMNDTPSAHIDSVTIIISIAFSILAICSLAFLYIFSNILSSSGVYFIPWSVHSFRASWLPSCVLVLAYLVLVILFIITIVWKCFLNVYIISKLGISIAPGIIIYLLFLIHAVVLQSSPFVLCFTIRAICNQLRFETDNEIGRVKEVILKGVLQERNLTVRYFENIERVLCLSSRLKIISTLNIIIVFLIVSTIFLSAFNEEGGILAVREEGFKKGNLPYVAYLWLVFVSIYLLLLTLLFTQNITALNGTINKFSDLVLIDKKVREKLTILAKENRKFLTEILRNLHFISRNKSRYEIHIFGDLSNELFPSILVFGLVIMLPFVLEVPDFLQEFKIL
ncbi:hypothetical protein LOD99_12204 [Oopsacas minuta]|uniref:Gustatory receptor n=1 Tax=Oopsacas minuta TaxID=111878 RepID=A0AAV7JEJ4_9METZ|nr:hypothetical protein LOD99_12204 [Oopsacas minuta]